MTTTTAATAVDAAHPISDVEAGERTPLLPRQVGTLQTPPAPDETSILLQDMINNSNKEIAITSLSAVSFVMSVLTLLWADAAQPILYVSGIIGALIAPYAALQQHKITETDTLAASNALMSEQVQLLQDENERKQRQVQELEESVRSLHVMQETLEAVRGVEGKSIQVLEQQLEESKTILNSLETSTQAEILQQLTNILLASELGDDDHDVQLVISDKEIEQMIERMEAVNGVDVSDKLFRQTIVQHGRSVNAIMEVIRNLLRDDVPEEQRIFIVHK